MRLDVKVMSALLLAVSASLAHAEEKPAFLDPGLAISVEADEAELSQETNTSIYRGNVRLERGPLVMSGKELRVSRSTGDERISATLTGSPAQAQFRDPAAPTTPVIARAQAITYTTGTEVLELRGQAQIERGEDQLQGENIRYEIPLARIQATGEGKERVKITIVPPEQSAEEKP